MKTKQKVGKKHPGKLKKMSAYMILTLILISIVAVLFAFPLYWIITGSFKTGAAINATGGPASGCLPTIRSCLLAKAPLCGSWQCPLAVCSAPTASPSTSR